MWWDDAFWVIPLTGLVGAVVVDSIVDATDEAFANSELTLLSPSSAVTLLAAIGGGMITFTGFVFSVVLLIIQFGSSSYSPRTVSYFLRSQGDPIGAGDIRRNEHLRIPGDDLHRVGGPGYVRAFLGSAGVSALPAGQPGGLSCPDPERGGPDQGGCPAVRSRQIACRALTRHSPGTSRQQVDVLDAATEMEDGSDDRPSPRKHRSGSCDRCRPAGRMAARSGAQVVFKVRVGDGIAPGTPVALLAKDSGVERFDRCVLVHRERSLKYDPVYALRILTDVGLRALSPAINDPTTAVRALDEVEAVLRTAAPLALGPVRILAGSGSVIVNGTHVERHR